MAISILKHQRENKLRDKDKAGLMPRDTVEKQESLLPLAVKAGQELEIRLKLASMMVYLALT